jgi:hypothetical protein
MVTTEMKNSVCQESRNNVCRDIRGPEAGETNGQFPVLVEIAQIKDDLSRLIICQEWHIWD